jgi:phenylacetate-CoA ligase
MNTPWDHIFNEGTGLGTSLTMIMYHKPYRETYDFIQQSQWWTADQIQEYQWRQLKTMLNHAYMHVPYYKKLFDIQGISPQNVQSHSDFHRIPFLTKALVQKHIDDLRATNYPAYAFEKNVTGGSTGFPLRFYVEKGVWYARHIAYIQALIERAGCHVMDKSVHMTDIDKPWEYRPLSRELVLSLFHMTDTKLPIYVKKIIEFHPEYIIGYPSGITILAQYIKRNDITINPLKAIIYYGETLYDWQREFLESTFHCRVHGQYGHRENCILAGTCEKSNCYHVFPDYGFVELIDTDGNQVVKEGQIGEIVATGFHTGIFPFIRYKTGDIAVFTTSQCECGRHYPLLKTIEGRVQDFIISKSHRYIPFYGVHHLAATSSPNVKEWQIYQDHEGEIVFNIVKKEQFSDDDMHQILKNFQRRYRDEFTVTFNYTDSIPRTSRGKYQFLIQKLPIRF